MKSKLTILLLIPLLLSGCKKNKDTLISCHMPSYIRGLESGYTVELSYNDNVFTGDAKEVDKKLAMLSYGSVVSNTYPEFVKDYFEQMDFDNIYLSEDYAEPKEDTINYLMGHKSINGNDVIAISIRGFEYGKEWVSNLTMGKTGDHEGFSLSANKVYSKLKEYISSNEYENIKLWITGYSRAGGVSNVLSHYIFTRKEIDVDASNMYTYTFEAPRGLLKANAPEYENVHNFLNTADVVPLVAPAQFDIYRCGHDIDIYVNDVDTLVKQFDKKIKMPAFTAEEILYKDETEFDDWVINTALAEHESHSLHTRELFVDNIQDSLAYLMGCYYSLNYQQQNEFINDISEGLSITQLLDLLFSDDALHDLLVPYLEKYEISYDDDRLRSSCSQVIDVLKVEISGYLSTLLVRRDNFSRMINMHMPEINYVLMLNWYNS